ncbi:hypothetical protein C8A00DRAFT_10943, partial [Chaetomidium leptoderma]
DQLETDLFRGLFLAAHGYRSLSKLDLSRALCDADFITDSVSMTQLYAIAVAACHGIPPDTPVPALKLVAHHLHGKIFMKAYHPPSPGIKKDATGRDVPPRYRFCERMDAAEAQSFTRATWYRLKHGPGQDGLIYNMVIQDGHLTEPVPRRHPYKCVDGCIHHGKFLSHAVPIMGKAAENDHHPPPSLGILHQRQSMPIAEAPLNFRNNKSKEISPQCQEVWATSKKRELCALAAILRLIQTETQALAADRGDGIQVLVDLQRTSDTILSARLGGGMAAEHELVFEELVTEKKLVSKEDSVTLRD